MATDSEMTVSMTMAMITIMMMMTTLVMDLLAVEVAAVGDMAALDADVVDPVEDAVDLGHMTKMRRREMDVRDSVRDAAGEALGDRHRLCTDSGHLSTNSVVEERVGPVEPVAALMEMEAIEIVTKIAAKRIAMVVLEEVAPLGAMAVTEAKEEVAALEAYTADIGDVTDSAVATAVDMVGSLPHAETRRKYPLSAGKSPTSGPSTVKRHTNAPVLSTVFPQMSCFVIY